jgi:hypothetical protein
MNSSPSEVPVGFSWLILGLWSEQTRVLAKARSIALRVQVDVKRLYRISGRELFGIARRLRPRRLLSIRLKRAKVA